MVCDSSIVARQSSLAISLHSRFEVCVAQTATGFIIIRHSWNEKCMYSNYDNLSSFRMRLNSMRCCLCEYCIVVACLIFFCIEVTGKMATEATAAAVAVLSVEKRKSEASGWRAIATGVLSFRTFPICYVFAYNAMMQPCNSTILMKETFASPPLFPFGILYLNFLLLLLWYTNVHSIYDTFLCNNNNNFAQ